MNSFICHQGAADLPRCSVLFIFMAGATWRNEMRFRLAALLLTTTCLVPALAEDIRAPSHIDAITVFPQGADVVRVSEVTLQPGEHTLILDDLPGTIDTQSIRVEGAGGSGLEIASVDSKLVQLSSEEVDAQRKVIDDQIEVLSDERAALDQTVSDAEYSRKLLLSLADKQLVPASSTETVKSVDVTQLGGLVDLVGARMGAISKTVHDAQIRQRAIDKQIADLQVKASALAPDDRAHVQVSVHIAAATQTEGKFKLSYRVQEAGWVPFYDARMTLPAKGEAAKLNLVRRAEVTQSTGESWNDVALTLSTARPTGATAAPELREDEIQIASDQERRLRGELDAAAPASVSAPKIEESLNGLAKDKADVADKPIMQRQAEIQMAGFNANYIIAGRVTVDNTGTAKKVRIATDEFAAKLQAITVPRLDTTAYLTASFSVKGDAPLLPGVVNLYRDGMFMGQGSIPLLSSGEDAKLGFGADDLIKVKRVEVKRNNGEEGILTSSNVHELAWDISVTNLHDVAIPVTVIDRAPFSTQENITVTSLPDATPATTKDFEKRRGVLAWAFDLEPKAEKTIKTGYKVTSPQAVNISLNE
jgi:uncharacterized protein (TIGR02231 family)